MKGLPPILTWDGLLCLAAFLCLVALLLPWRPMRAVWWKLSRVVLYLAIYATIFAGFVHAMAWSTPPEPVAGFLQKASEAVVELTDIRIAIVRPWSVLLLTSLVVLLQLALIQLLSFGGQVRMFNLLSRLSTSTPRDGGSDDGGSDDLPTLFARGDEPTPPQDDIQTARRGLNALVRRSGGPAKQSLHKWLQT